MAADHPPSKSFLESIRSVFSEGNYSDFTVECGERSWKVHKLVICAQSDFFKKACNGEFKEAQTSKATLKEDDQQVVAAMIRYFYHFEYNDEDHAPFPPTPLNMHVCLMAEKYDIKPLQTLAQEKFLKRAEAEWNTPVFAAAVTVAYGSEASCTTEFRKTILDITQEHAASLFDATKPESEPFRVAAKENPQFLLDHAAKASGAAPPTGPDTAPWTSKLVDSYRCPGKYCKDNGSVFTVNKKTSVNLHISCPLRCTYNRTKDWWEEHRIKDPVVEDKSVATSKTATEEEDVGEQ